MAKSIKALAGQTIYYGLSNIAAKFLNQLLTPLLTYLLRDAEGIKHFGELTLLYAAISMANIVFTYGMETAYFRFSNTDGVSKKQLFDTSFGSLLISSFVFGALLIYFRVPIAGFFELQKYPEYVTFSAVVIMLDAITRLPLAKLRQENRPKQYALTNVAGVVINILFVLLLIVYGRQYVASHPSGTIAEWYGQFTDTGFLIMANIAASFTTLILLVREWGSFRFKIDGPLLKRVLAYALPFVIIGMGGMINETFDRILLQKLLPYYQDFHYTIDQAKQQVGIYSANYRIAIFITLFIQAFRMAAEPFFFAQAADKNAPKTYANVMKWFVITLCLAFLFTALFLNVWKYFINRNYWGGLGIVPILLFANIALGIYYNLAVWYKNSGKLGYGTWITLVGVAITLGINVWGIPKYGMFAAAWATFFCYVSMMVMSYYYGQKYYPIPYEVKKLLGYILAILLLYAGHRLFSFYVEATWLRLSAGVLGMFAFLAIVAKAEAKELSGMRFIGRLMKRH